jgi:cell wall-associated NlpC family hydrolase
VGVTEPTPSPPTIGETAADISTRYLGIPYIWAGSTPSGFDCSGFTRFVYGRLGVELPHSTYEQWPLGWHPPRSALRPGDLVFFGLGHVGLYLGKGRFIHSPHSGEVVSIERLDQGGYAESYSGAVRLRAAQALVLP